MDGGATITAGTTAGTGHTTVATMDGGPTTETSQGAPGGAPFLCLGRTIRAEFLHAWPGGLSNVALAKPDQRVERVLFSGRFSARLIGAPFLAGGQHETLDADGASPA